MIVTYGIRWCKIIKLWVAVVIKKEYIGVGDENV